MLRFSRVLMSGFLFLLVPAMGSAVPLAYTFASVLASDPGGAAAGSTTADVILIFDSLTPDLDPTGSIGEYAVQSARIEFENGHISTVSDVGSFFVSVGLGLRWLQGSVPGDFGVSGTGGFPTTDALPTSNPGAVTAHVVNFVTTDDLGMILPFASTLTITPEPSLAGLLGLALWTLHRRGHLRRSRS